MTEWTIATLKEHWEAIHKRDQEALKIQATEYERRLDNLNHEHARISEAQKTYVSYSVLFGFFGLIIAAVAIWWKH